MEKLIERLKALGDESRFKIFLLLSEKQICASGLAKNLGITESAVSQHLKVLKNCGLIKGEKVGYFVHYQVQKKVLEEIKNLIGELAEDTVDMEKFKADLQKNSGDCAGQCCCQKEEG